jgi:serine/threonine protein kinase
MDQTNLSLPKGTELNHYVIESVLGQGGFGIVYLARHAFLDELVALKEFLPIEVAGRSGLSIVPHGDSRKQLYDDALRRFMS